MCQRDEQISCGAQNLRVYETDPKADPRWEQFVAAHADGSIYHHPAWITALEQEYGQKPGHLVCENPSGELLSILPMLYTRGLPFRMGRGLTAPRLSSLPRTPLAGPLSKTPEATVAILKAAIERTKPASQLQLQIKTQRRELDGLVDGIAGTPWRMSYVLKLPDRASGPFRIATAHYRGNVRWAVQKASNEGVFVRFAETEADLREWYGVYLETMRRNVVLARSYRFFETLWKLLKHRNLMHLLLAVQDAPKPWVVAGSIFLTYGRTVSYAFNGSSARGLALGANDSIQWRAINDACEQGFELFDFGEVPDGNTGLAKFKSKWGSSPIRLYRYHYPEPPASLTPESRLSGSVVSLGKTVWRYLPLSATSWISNRIYSHLSIAGMLLAEFLWTL